jgi:hypothetical protein
MSNYKDQAKQIAKTHLNKDQLNKHKDTVFKAVQAQYNKFQERKNKNSVLRRDLEGEEDFFERDLDVEELFGREYDPLDERDNGDLFVRDFDNEDSEFFGREYDFLDERDIIDSEDLFVRDLEADELFGREYGLLDEQYY